MGSAWKQDPSQPGQGGGLRSKPSAAVPREHGAWFMLGHCLVLGALVSGHLRMPVLLVSAASLLWFMATRGLKQLARRLRSGESLRGFRLPRPAAGFLLGSAMVGGGAVIGWGLEVLLFWAALGAGLTIVYGWVLLRRRERSLTGEWVGVVGLTLSTGPVWSAGTGRLGEEAFLLWGLAVLYFGGSVPYVRLRVRQMKSPGASFRHRLRVGRGALLYSSAALAAVVGGARGDIIPGLAVLPFVLLLAKVVWSVSRGRGPAGLVHVGYGEVVYSTVFTAITIMAFWLQATAT
ncbi:MAG: YwiC-like family protein [Acidobacteriota bacterium]